MLAFSLALVGGLCWFGWAQRAQYLLVVRLHETQEQLREQMARGEALAAEQERTRIARDIHDVLSHSLAVLSIQVQAARHLMSDPERLTAKLDDMAMLIRESMAESRRVVGMTLSFTSSSMPLSTSAFKAGRAEREPAIDRHHLQRTDRGVLPLCRERNAPQRQPSTEGDAAAGLA